jgi:putative glutamine amidotransferase
MTPLVAVLGQTHPTEPDRATVHRYYLEALWLVGGQPVIFTTPPPAAYDSTLAALDRCDALILTGGGDVDPSYYGEATKAELKDPDPARDAFEPVAVRHWLATGKPLLGICRGFQMLVVTLGGRLHQDLVSAGYPSHWHYDEMYQPIQDIKATAGSLADLALNGRTRVNSIHHQGIADVGPELIATAWAPDGLVEAVELEGRPVLGVQWHPDRLACPPEPYEADKGHLAVFEWLVGAAAPMPEPVKVA